MPLVSAPTVAQQQRPLDRLIRFAEERGFVVTSTNKDRHVEGSAHYDDRAIDVSVRGKSRAVVDALIAAARAVGFKVIDERPYKSSPHWTAPHIHIEVPKIGAKVPDSERVPVKPVDRGLWAAIVSAVVVGVLWAQGGAYRSASAVILLAALLKPGPDGVSVGAGLIGKANKTLFGG